MGDRLYAVGRAGEVRPARVSRQRRVPPYRASITRFTNERVLLMRAANGRRDTETARTLTKILLSVPLPLGRYVERSRRAHGYGYAKDDGGAKKLTAC